MVGLDPDFPFSSIFVPPRSGDGVAQLCESEEVVLGANVFEVAQYLLGGGIAVFPLLVDCRRCHLRPNSYKDVLA